MNGTTVANGAANGTHLPENVDKRNDDSDDDNEDEVAATEGGATAGWQNSTISPQTTCTTDSIT